MIRNWWCLNEVLALLVFSTIPEVGSRYGKQFRLASSSLRSRFLRPLFFLEVVSPPLLLSLGPKSFSLGELDHPWWDGGPYQVKLKMITKKPLLNYYEIERTVRTCKSCGNAGFVVSKVRLTPSRKILKIVFLLLPKMSLTINHGVHHAKKVTLDQSHVANDTFEAVEMVQEASGPHHQFVRTNSQQTPCTLPHSCFRS